MCLGIPGRVVEVLEEGGTRMARMDFDGIVKDVSLAYLPSLAPGDYAIVHVGFAISQIDEASAQRSLELMRAQGVLEEELDPLAAEAAAAMPHGGPA